MTENNNFVNILMGPKLGDLMHSLTVPAYYYKFLGIKTNFYLNEVYDKFSTSLERTYEELFPILSKQPYINSFEIYNPKIHTVIHEDLNAFRYNGLLYTRSFWAVFLHTAFQSPISQKKEACSNTNCMLHSLHNLPQPKRLPILNG